MKKKWKVWLIGFLLFWLLPICSRRAGPAERVVTRVDVSCCTDRGRTVWIYTQQEKMEVVLNYLRLRQPVRYADVDPERLRGNSWLVVTRLSDGTQNSYRLRGGRYFSGEYHLWQELGESEITQLQMLLLQLPTDV